MFRTCCLSYTPGLQCLGLCSGGFLSPTSRLDAGAALGHGRCSSHDQSAPPPPCSCVSTLESSTSLTSASSFTTALASPRASGKTGALASADRAPPPFSRFVLCTSGGFKRSGQKLVACHSETYCSLSSYGSPFTLLQNYPPVPQTGLLTIVRISSALRTTRDDAGAFLVLKHGHATTQYESTQRERVMIRDRRVAAVCRCRLLLTERTVLAAGTAIVCVRFDVRM
jgi:hypothetical protein